MGKNMPNNVPGNYIKRDYISLMESVKDKIYLVIKKKGRAKFWFADDFIVCGNNDSVRKALQALTNEEFILRITTGVYYYPKIDKQLGLGTLLPSKEEIAFSIAKHEGIKIAPTGAFALNALGLSTQMQTKVIFLTNARARQINLGDGRYIQFLHSSAQRLFTYRSYAMILIIQAMLALGEADITDDVRQAIRERKCQVSERDFLHDIKIAPIWAQEILKTL